MQRMLYGAAEPQLQLFVSGCALNDLIQHPERELLLFLHPRPLFDAHMVRKHEQRLEREFPSAMLLEGLGLFGLREVASPQMLQGLDKAGGHAPPPLSHQRFERLEQCALFAIQPDSGNDSEILRVGCFGRRALFIPILRLRFERVFYDLQEPLSDHIQMLRGQSWVRRKVWSVLVACEQQSQQLAVDRLQFVGHQLPDLPALEAQKVPKTCRILLVPDPRDELPQPGQAILFNPCAIPKEQRCDLVQDGRPEDARLTRFIQLPVDERLQETDVLASQDVSPFVRFEHRHPHTLVWMKRPTHNPLWASLLRLLDALQRFFDRFEDRTSVV